jgi:hypothetical protein
MIPPSPLPFPLWGPTLYADLTAGLWRALAAPWLETGGWRLPVAPAPATDAAAHRAPGTAVDSNAGMGEARAAGAPPAPAAPGGGQVIEVPAARWRRHGRS